MNSLDIVIVIFVIILFLASALIGPNWLTYQAMKKIVRALKKNNSWDQASASSAEQIGVVFQSRWSSMFKFRDYRPRALDQLVQVKIVIQTPQGKFFLNKMVLDNSRLKDA